MPVKTPEDVNIGFNNEENCIIPDTEEQLPLQIYSSEDGCFVYDNHGAELGYTYRQDWENNPELSIVTNAQQLKTAYESPTEMLRNPEQEPPVFNFYDPEYPTEDVSCKQTNQERFFTNRDLPPLNARDSINPKQSLLSVETEDHYTEDQPSVVTIHENNTVLKEWTVEHSDNQADTVELGATVAWNIRLAYERPWELLE